MRAAQASTPPSSTLTEANPAARAVKVETTATPSAILQVLEEAGYPATSN